MYTPLNNARSELRLLKLSRRSTHNPEEPLNCKLSVHALTDVPAYTALSYAWGDPKDTRAVVVNGKIMQATTNLVDALLQQRELGLCLWWVDALCINQEDGAEKAEQIRLMATIYERASSVIAWTGLADATTSETFNTMAEICALGWTLTSFHHLFDHANLSMYSFPQLIQKGDDLVVALRDDSTLKPGDLGRILTFFRRPYWTRLWTVQELCLAHGPRVACGPYSTSWKIVGMAAVLLSTIHYARLSDTRELHDPEFQALCAPFNARLCSWAGPRAAPISARLRDTTDRKLAIWDLFDLTCNDTNLQATDPKDRIYAILGLMTEAERDAFTGDPQASCTDLYVQATMHMLARYGPRVFTLSTPACQTVPSLNLPSWVVDWTCAKDRIDRGRDYVVPLRDPYPCRRSTSNTLILQAALIGSILTAIPFAGELDEVRDIVDKIEQSSLLHSGQAILPDHGMQAWRALLAYVPNYRGMEIRWLDDYTRRCAQQAATAKKGRLQSMDKFTADSSVHTGPLESEPASLDEDYEHFKSKFPILYENIVFVTGGGHIGCACDYVEPRLGDAVYAFPGYGYPFVLRPDNEVDGAPTWSLVGKVIIEELMEPKFESGRKAFTLECFWEGGPALEEVRLC